MQASPFGGGGFFAISITSELTLTRDLLKRVALPALRLIFLEDSHLLEPSSMCLPSWHLPLGHFHCNTTHCIGLLGIGQLVHPFSRLVGIFRLQQSGDNMVSSLLLLGGQADRLLVHIGPVRKERTTTHILKNSDSNAYDECSTGSFGWPLPSMVPRLGNLPVSPMSFAWRRGSP